MSVANETKVLHSNLWKGHLQDVQSHLQCSALLLFPLLIPYTAIHCSIDSYMNKLSHVMRDLNLYQFEIAPPYE